MAFVEYDECDYCHGKGWYLMDGKKETCFCAGEKSVTITDKTLKRLLREPGGEHSEIERMSDKHLTRFAVECARELLASRPVVRLLRKLHAGESVTKSAVSKALDAYDKARKGKVT